MHKYKRFEVVVTKDFKKDLDSIKNPKLRDRIINMLKELENFPQCLLDIKKVKGEKDVFRIRIGKYRIFFRLDKKERRIIVLSIAHRGRAYK